MNTYNLGATSQPGTDVMILKIFSPIFFFKLLLILFKTLIIILVFEKKAYFSLKIGKNVGYFDYNIDTLHNSLL
jgi:hypothetical protein